MNKVVRRKSIQTVQKSLIAGIGLVMASGCVGDIPGSSPSDDGPEIGSTQSRITMGRMAVEEGLTIGTTAIVSSIERQLGESTIAFVFEAGTSMAPPAPSIACPFIPQVQASATQGCRELAERARDSAYVRMSAELDRGPQAAALQTQGDPELYSFISLWHQQGSFSGVDGEVVRAETLLRNAGVCDQTITGVQSSRLAGYEEGRSLYIAEMNKIRPGIARTECDYDRALIAPALASAESLVKATLQARPLCDGFVPNGANVAAEFDQAKLGYEFGMVEGLRDQATLSSQELFETWTCEVPMEPERPTPGLGDPLVVDLDGDGITPTFIRDGVSFDMGGTGVIAKVAWPSGDDALLTIDLNDNGAIDNGRELFSNYMRGPGNARFADGFEALAMYDRRAMGGNDDQVIDEKDRVYEKLLVWRDANRDGHSSPDELLALADTDVASISLKTNESSKRLGDALLSKQSGQVGELWLQLDY
jgi:hypothetical protein